MATHSSILAWEIPWTEGPGRLQFMGLQRVRDDWNDLACTHTCVYICKHTYVYNSKYRHQEKSHFKVIKKPFSINISFAFIGVLFVFSSNRSFGNYQIYLNRLTESPGLKYVWIIPYSKPNLAVPAFNNSAWNPLLHAELPPGSHCFPPGIIHSW